MSTPSRYWRRRKADRDDQPLSSGEHSVRASPSNSPQMIRAKKPPVDRRRPHSPKPSPLFRRLSALISKSTRGSKRKHTKHEFEHIELIQPTWCDLCDDIIWGLLRPCVQCKRCMYTCHLDCADSVELSCVRQADSAPREPHVHPRQSQEGIDAGAQGLLAYLTAMDVAAKVDKYNCNRTSNFIEMLDSEPGSKNFKGHIRVTLNLTRPIRVSSDDSIVNNSPDQSECLAVPVSPALAPSSQRFFRSSGSASSFGSNQHEGETFFLPKHVSKGLYVTSATTAQEVIAILLRKFRVTSNPRKFALFERNTATGTERRLRRFEEPLALQLLWGDRSEDFELFLKEYNQDYEFHWEEFSLAELENFVKILDREEQAACEQIRAGFNAQREVLEELLEQTGSTKSDASGDTTTTPSSSSSSSKKKKKKKEDKKKKKEEAEKAEKAAQHSVPSEGEQDTKGSKAGDASQQHQHQHQQQQQQQEEEQANGPATCSQNQGNGPNPEEAKDGSEDGAKSGATRKEDAKD